ncbi:MAG: helicase [Epsilonproteobacteria bacterium]|nr:helicase [Campylobacterota bacterium]
MGKKRKKFVKYNQSVRKIFGGVGFDEGVTRLSLDQLIELAMVLELKEPSLTKPDLIRAMRRVWSGGEAFHREAIVAYLEGLDTLFGEEGTVSGLQERHAKIDAILADIPHTPEEASAVRAQFETLKSKKITPKKIAKALEKMRRRRKKEGLESALGGTFDEEGRFLFYADYLFALKTPIQKSLLTVCEPIEPARFDGLDEAELKAHLGALKERAVATKARQVEAISELACRSNPYLSLKSRREALENLPADGDLTAPPLPTEAVRDALLAQSGAEQVAVGKEEVLVFGRFTHEMMGDGAWRVDYRLPVRLARKEVYEGLWHGRDLGIKARLESENRARVERFEAELEALVSALLGEGEALGIGRREVEESVARTVAEEVRERQSLEIPYQTLKEINRHFAKRIEALRLQRQREELLARAIRDFKNLFPLARALKRRLIFHVGPTNSGKTYAAMQRLKRADTGYYLAPLRLLALEGYESLLADGIPASLVTGEEQMIDEEAAHISSTIEMANFQVDVDVCVIDEVQMIDDPDRGWAWANAIIGIPAKEVIMTGSEDALAAIRELAEWLGEPLEVVRFERKGPLTLLDKPSSMKKLEPGTAIVAFSRKDVLTLKEQLASRYSVSVVYGNLSPEVRREEARRFREGESQVLVATDAIAMGLNLPIKTLLFARDSKFDGQSRRPLYPSEIRQIAGRAGRFGLHEAGFVGALSHPVLQSVTELIDAPAPPIQGPYRVMANLEHIELIASIIQTESLAEILGFFVKHMRFDGPFVAANIENMLQISRMVDMYRLDLKTKYHLACAPLTVGSAYLESVFHRYLIALEQGCPIGFAPPESLPETAATADMLFDAEERVKEVSLYLWLSYRFPDAFVDTERARTARETLNRFIERSLRKGVFARACRRCGAPLPAGFKFGICQNCYKGRSIFRNGRRKK